jgi:hypothetical protein
MLSCQDFFFAGAPLCLVAYFVLAAIFISPLLLKLIARLTSGTKLWLAGGVAAALMFVAGVFWAICGVR